MSATDRNQTIVFSGHNLSYLLPQLTVVYIYLQVKVGVDEGVLSFFNENEKNLERTQ